MTRKCFRFTKKEATCALLIALALSGCVNARKVTGLRSSLLTAPSGVSTPTAYTMKVSSVSILTGSSSSTTTTTSTVPTTNILFDTTQSTESIALYCNVTTTSSTTSGVNKPCNCQFTWNEVNSSSGSSAPILRMVQTSVNKVQPSMVSCPAPDKYATEIMDGTMIKVTVLPAAGNTTTFSIAPYNYTKSSSVVSGSFQDAQGQAFDNILHYSCYEQYKRGTTIRSRMATITNPTTGENVRYPLATQFCVQKISGNNTAQQGCEGMPGMENSAQSYYYNLYIRDSERGDINNGNARYSCPTVKESLIGNGTVGTQNQFWPLDSNFSLSLGPTPNFNVGVVAVTKTSNGQDAVVQKSTCSPGSQSSAPADNTLVTSCLGFAAKPNQDGTCPYFRDANGQLRLTYRLRRYVAIYPPIFDTDGFTIANQGQATDTIYVLDRPVNSTTADPLKPFTMRGPKPCPFAYFDPKGVASGNDPSYVATNDARWAGKNVDGIELPNFDGPLSCSAAIPLLDSSKSTFSIETIHSSNPVRKRLFIRPIQPWGPHYEEDTDFQACAPQAQPMRDPPLHFAKDPVSGNVSWCAENYPSQNDNVSQLDYRIVPTDANSSFSGCVAPFTSHVVKNSSSAACRSTAVALPSGYPAVGAIVCADGRTSGRARHPASFITDGDLPAVGSNQSCDRTVTGSTPIWAKFPLIAPPNDVEAMIRADSSYSCTVSYDSNGVKAGKSTPTQGCCGNNVQVWTGNAAPYAANQSGHLEPDVPCLIPQY